jgi:hypothetical protein
LSTGFFFEFSGPRAKKNSGTAQKNFSQKWILAAKFFRPGQKKFLPMAAHARSSAAARTKKIFPCTKPARKIGGGQAGKKFCLYVGAAPAPACPRGSGPARGFRHPVAWLLGGRRHAGAKIQKGSAAAHHAGGRRRKKIPKGGGGRRHAGSRRHTKIFPQSKTHTAAAFTLCRQSRPLLRAPSKSVLKFTGSFSIFSTSPHSQF